MGNQENKEKLPPSETDIKGNDSKQKPHKQIFASANDNVAGEIKNLQHLMENKDLESPAKSPPKVIKNEGVKKKKNIPNRPLDSYSELPTLEVKKKRKKKKKEKKEKNDGDDWDDVLSSGEELDSEELDEMMGNRSINDIMDTHSNDTIDGNSTLGRMIGISIDVATPNPQKETNDSIFEEKTFTKEEEIENFLENAKEGNLLGLQTIFKRKVLNVKDVIKDKRASMALLGTFRTIQGGRDSVKQLLEEMETSEKEEKEEKEALKFNIDENKHFSFKRGKTRESFDQHVEVISELMNLDNESWSYETLLYCEGNEKYKNELIDQLMHYNKKRINIPLLQACEDGNLFILRKLIENGADVNYQEEETGNNTPLIMVAKSFSLKMMELVKLLLEKGANPELKNDKKESFFDICFDDEVLEYVKNATGKTEERKIVDGSEIISKPASDFEPKKEIEILKLSEIE